MRKSLETYLLILVGSIQMKAGAEISVDQEWVISDQGRRQKGLLVT